MISFAIKMMCCVNLGITYLRNHGHYRVGDVGRTAFDSYFFVSKECAASMVQKHII